MGNWGTIPREDLSLAVEQIGEYFSCFEVDEKWLHLLTIFSVKFLLFDSPATPTLQLSNHPYASPTKTSLPKTPTSPIPGSQRNISTPPSKLSPLNPRSRLNVGLKLHPSGSPNPKFKTSIPSVPIRPRRPSVQDEIEKAKVTSGGNANARRPLRAPIPSCLPPKKPAPTRGLPALPSPPLPPTPSTTTSVTSSLKQTEEEEEEELKQEMEIALILSETIKDEEIGGGKKEEMLKSLKKEDEILGFGETELERKTSIERTKALLVALRMRKLSTTPELQIEKPSTQVKETTLVRENSFKATLLEIKTRDVSHSESFKGLEKFNNTIVKLNIGGKEFLTSASTLLGNGDGLSMFVRECLGKGSQDLESTSSISKTLTLNSNSSSSSLKVPASRLRPSRTPSKRSASPVFHSPFLQTSSPSNSTTYSNCSTSSTSSDEEDQAFNSEDEDEARSLNFHSTNPFALSLSPRGSLTRSDGILSPRNFGNEIQSDVQEANWERKKKNNSRSSGLKLNSPDPRRSESKFCPSDVELDSDEEDEMSGVPELVQSRRSSLINPSEGKQIRFSKTPKLTFTSVSPTSSQFRETDTISQVFERQRSRTETGYQSTTEVVFLSIFLDRNPKVYEILLDALRSNELPSTLIFKPSFLLSNEDLDSASSSTSDFSETGLGGNRSQSRLVRKKIEKLEALEQEASWCGFEELKIKCQLQVQKWQGC